MNRPLLFALSATLLMSLADAGAQTYPARPIRLILPQSPGASQDVITRIVANKMSELLGQQVVIDNRAGAGGVIALELGAHAIPDGYTLVGGASSSFIVTKFTYHKLPFDSLKDFLPISMIVNADALLVVHPSVTAKSVKELIAFARSQPNRLNMASAGIGSSSHLAGIMFVSMAGIESTHVPYKGGGPMAGAVVGGEAQWAVSPAAAFAGHVKAGRVRALAVAGRSRSALMPDLPTIDESGVPGYDFSSWNGIFAPRGTARAVITMLHATIQKALAAQDVKDLYAAQGLVPLGSASPEEFGKLVREDFERIAKLIRISGIKPQ